MEKEELKVEKAKAEEKVKVSSGSSRQKETTQMQEEVVNEKAGS